MEQEVKHEIAAMWDAGMKIPAIATELLMSAQTIRMALKEMGKDTSRGAKHASLDEVALIAEYVAGESVAELLKRHKITYNILYRILDKTNTPTRKLAEAAVSNVRMDRAVEMYIAGLPLWSIHQETGIAQPTLHAVLHARNIPLRRPRML